MRAVVAPRVFTALEDQSPVLHEAAVAWDDDGIIRDVGPARHVVQKGWDVTEVDGAILPGLIDAHTHICLSASADPGRDVREEHPAKIALRAAAHMRAHLDAGTTTIRDVGGVHGIDLELMRQQAAGELEGPEVLAAGNVLCCTGGHACFMGVECDSPAEIRKAARQQLKDGARLVKVIATGGVITPGVFPGAQQLGEDELRAACEVAHRAGLRVAAHAQGAEGIVAALHAGVDTIEHGFWLTDDAVRFMRENDRTLVPTFSALSAMLDRRAELPDFINEKLDVVAGPLTRSFARARKADVRLVTGTDAGTPYNEHGDIRTELLAFQREGVSPLDCLRASTMWAAEALGLPDRGAVAAGRRADLVAFDAAVLDDMEHARAPKLVVQGGRIVRGG
jgi:imidazolonepropionase-like amidohydrolase